jgi:CRISPR-associated protein Cmr3
MKLKISLKPLDKFFFGGENSFTEPGVSKDRDRRATYMLKSRKYPQQTALLGFVRNQLLLQNGVLVDNSEQITDKVRAKELIGNHGFMLNYKGSYGAIKRISPCFLETAEGSILMPAPLDEIPERRIALKINGDDVYLENYTDKIGLSHHVVNIKTGELQKLSEIFVETERTGIAKSTKPWGESSEELDDETGYYYQTFYRFNRQLKGAPDKFVFYLELDDDVQFTAGVVEMGGERSSFRMNVIDLEKNKLPWPEMPVVSYKHTNMTEGNLNHLICLSPSKVELAELGKLTKLQVTETITFRFLEATVNGTTEYQRLGSTDKRSLTESKLYTLLDRGSVVHFHPDQQSDIETLFNNQPDMCNIGYNHYCII